jgi:sugar phosphate isomerase/epimerase
MKKSISNIAWSSEIEDDVLQLLQEENIKYVELAPTKVFGNWNPSDEEINIYLKKLETYDIKPCMFQAITFNKPELQLFDQSSDFIYHIDNVISLAGDLGVKNLVFGSPKNRIIENISDEEQAINIFRILGSFGWKKGVSIGLEHNPIEYGGNWIHTASEALDFVKRVNHPYFKIHLDTGAMYMTGEDIESTILKSLKWFDSIHLSQPMLSPSLSPVDFKSVIEILKNINYSGTVSIEMKNENNTIETIKRILQVYK